MKNRNKMNNNGFSLVELIIVIAIMAVLIGVLAPQYMKYVERGRVSTDKDNAVSIQSAMQVWASETAISGNYTLDSGGTRQAFTTGSATITVTRGSNVAVTGTPDQNKAAVYSALENAGLDLSTRCQSQTTYSQYIITVTVTSDGTVTVSNDIP